MDFGLRVLGLGFPWRSQFFANASLPEESPLPVPLVVNPLNVMPLCIRGKTHYFKVGRGLLLGKVITRA